MSESKLPSWPWMTQPTRRTDFWLGVGIFIIAAGISFAFWSLIPSDYQENQSTDYTSFYEPVARSIAAGHGVMLNGALATRYPPGFPLIIAATFQAGEVAGLSDEGAMTVFRLLCAGLSAALIFATSRLVWQPMPALIAALAWATYPFGLWLTKQPNSEIAFIPLLFGAVYLLWRALVYAPRAWLLYLGAGLLAGAAMLVRPAGIGLGFVFALMVFLFAKRSTSWLTRAGLAVLILIGNLMVVVPWQSSVYAQTGRFIPLGSGGTITIKDGLTFLAIPKDYRREVEVPEDVAAMMVSFQNRRQEMNEMGGLILVVKEEMSRDPAAFAKIIGIKATRSWYGIDSRQFEGITLTLQIIYLGLAVWGSWYAWRQGGHLRHLIVGNWLIVGYFWAMTMLVVPLLRYSLPGMGLLMMAIPGAFLWLMDARARRARPTTATPSADA